MRLWGRGLLLELVSNQMCQTGLWFLCPRHLGGLARPVDVSAVLNAVD